MNKNHSGMMKLRSEQIEYQKYLWCYSYLVHQMPYDTWVTLIDIEWEHRTGKAKILVNAEEVAIITELVKWIIDYDMLATLDTTLTFSNDYQRIIKQKRTFDPGDSLYVQRKNKNLNESDKERKLEENVTGERDLLSQFADNEGAET